MKADKFDPGHGCWSNDFASELRYAEPERAKKDKIFNKVRLRSERFSHRASFQLGGFTLIILLSSTRASIG